MSFFDIAYPLAQRGFRVFPLIPQMKRPVKMETGDHFDAASSEESQLRRWDREEPTANVGISPDEFFCFLETDAEAELKAACPDVPAEVWETARVTSGRPDRAYYIFRQTSRTRSAPIKDKSLRREGKENLFEFKAFRTLVTGPGSIHPITGMTYTAEWRPIIAMPDSLLDRLCELYGAPKTTDAGNMSDEVKTGTEKLDKFLEYYEVPTLGDWFNKGKSWFRPIECPWQSEHENQNQGTSTCVVLTDGKYGFNCKHRCDGKGWQEFKAELIRRFPNKEKFLFNKPGPEVIIGDTGDLVTEAELDAAFNDLGADAVVVKPAEPQPPKDWRTHYHTFEEMDTAPPAVFLIEGFLQIDAVTAIAAPVAQRKSLIALNVAHALCTKEALFEYFKVANPPTRVLYLCPEMGIRSFTERVRKIGLMPYVGKTLFCRTMSAEGALELPELTPEELQGAAVIIDTAIRYLKGDENSSEHMRVFAADIFRLIREGAASVLLLHHSGKTTKESPELSLENAMRGSGELGAFLSSCWATRLQDPSDVYNSASFIVNVKQRDFESKPFEATCSRETCRMSIVGVPGEARLVVNAKNKSDKDGKEAAAMEYIADRLKANPKTTLEDLESGLKTLGIVRRKTWLGKKRTAINKTGVTLKVG